MVADILHNPHSTLLSTLQENGRQSSPNIRRTTNGTIPNALPYTDMKKPAFRRASDTTIAAYSSKDVQRPREQEREILSTG